MIIRNETSSDIEAISRVTIAAFKNLAISNHTEQFIINALRNANALTVSLVAEMEVSMIGIMGPPIFAVMEPVKRVEKGSLDPPFNQAISPPFEGCFFVL